MKKELAEAVLEIDIDLTSGMGQEELSELRERCSEPVKLGSRNHQGSGEVNIGIIVGFEDSGRPLVDFPSNIFGEYLPAHSIVSLSKNEIGREAVLLFEEGNPQKPIVMGLIQHQEQAGSNYSDKIDTARQNGMAVEVAGERLLFTAEKEIVLRCGQASITLTRAGKVLIRGAYVLNRSSGANQIKGGSVQIN